MNFSKDRNRRERRRLRKAQARASQSGASQSSLSQAFCSAVRVSPVSEARSASHPFGSIPPLNLSESFTAVAHEGKGIAWTAITLRPPQLTPPLFFSRVRNAFCITAVRLHPPRYVTCVRNAFSITAVRLHRLAAAIASSASAIAFRIVHCCRSAYTSIPVRAETRAASSAIAFRRRQILFVGRASPNVRARA